MINCPVDAVPLFSPVAIVTGLVAFAPNCSVRTVNVPVFASTLKLPAPAMLKIASSAVALGTPPDQFAAFDHKLSADPLQVPVAAEATPTILAICNTPAVAASTRFIR